MTPFPAIVIAAGGEGRRIGGDKPQRLLAGRPLLDHALAIAAAQSDCIAIAVRDAGQIGPTFCPILLDNAPNLGPIGALASAFAFAAAHGRGTVMLIGCDQPFLPRDLAARLAGMLEGHGAVMPVANGKVQPLAALWRVDGDALARYIADGGRSLWRFAEAQGARLYDWPGKPDSDPFVNINSLETLVAAEWRLAQTKPAS